MLFENLSTDTMLTTLSNFSKFLSGFLSSISKDTSLLQALCFFIIYIFLMTHVG